jgi:C-terminal processing protease CtpA/Prc
MKKIFLSSFIVLFFVQCTSVKKQNAHLDDFIAVEKLQSDVDYTYKKLRKLHPKLYWYSSKETLDYKFDSLKQTITSPMKPLEFYKKLSPVVSAVRQGHTSVFPPTKEYSKRETKKLLKKGTGPFSQFEFGFDKDKMYVTKNKSYNKTIKKRTEVLAVNGIKPLDLIQEYNHYYSSDGYNLTFKENQPGKHFVSYFTTENGIKDSLNYIFKWNDSIKTITIKRYKQDTIEKKTKKKPKNITAIERKKIKANRRKKRVNGYNKDSKNFIRELSFIEPENSIVQLKINHFKKGRFRTFYRESFAEIEKKQAKTLILDLRNNGGGRLNEIVKLYSYLADSTFVFLDKSEVVSRASLFEGSYFNKGTVPLKIIKSIFSPFVFGYILLTVHKDKDGKNYFATKTTPHSVKKNAFKGNIYVLINGGSFSASSIISSNLKGSKRATFVGEETGGTYNGTVAGFMPVVKLPHSKLKIRIGNMLITPHYKTEQSGHGIFPDKEIKPILEDQIQEKDPELNWILDQFNSNPNN